MLKTFSITDIGRKRKMNQDYVFTSEIPVGNLPNIFIVADGMGGHNAGDYASRCTVETVVKEIERSSKTNPKELFADAIEVANREILTIAGQNEHLNGMGTTLVLATCEANKLTVANIGDSRLYVLGDELKQITKDHSFVEEMVRRGNLDKESAKNHPDKNIITRAIGADEVVEADFFEVELKEGDMVLMCSDGLTNMLEDEEIRMILNGQRDIVEKAEELVKAANENGGKDNIAVVLVEPSAE